MGGAIDRSRINGRRERIGGSCFFRWEISTTKTSIPGESIWQSINLAVLERNGRDLMGRAIDSTKIQYNKKVDASRFN